MRKPWVTLALAWFLVLGCLSGGEPGSEHNQPPYSKAHIAVLLTNNPFTDRLLELFATQLVDGDYLLVGGPDTQVQWILQKTEEARGKVKSGVHVFSWVVYVAIDTLEARTPHLPQGIDWVIYDYEGGPGFSPEFTPDPQASITFFERGRRGAHQYGARFMVTPPYAQLWRANWDWGVTARHMDGITLQFQAFLKDPQILETEVRKVVGQIHERAAQTLTFIQFSLVPERGTVADNMQAIQRLEDEAQIAAFLMFYRPDQIDTLRDFFSEFRRPQ